MAAEGTPPIRILSGNHPTRRPPQTPIKAIPPAAPLTRPLRTPVQRRLRLLAAMGTTEMATAEATAIMATETATAEPTATAKAIMVTETVTATAAMETAMGVMGTVAMVRAAVRTRSSKMCCRSGLSSARGAWIDGGSSSGRRNSGKELEPWRRRTLDTARFYVVRRQFVPKRLPAGSSAVDAN
jgi:hypothetical protein